MMFTGLNAVMLLFFVFAASVQLNDPDPIVWITLYLVAAIFCAAHAFKRLPPMASMAFACIALLWALTLVPTFWGRVSFGEVFGSAKMMSEEVEVAREFGGLMIVAAWMGLLGVRARR